MRNEIMTLTELTKNGVKVARLAGNRDLNEKAVKAKMKSLDVFTTDYYSIFYR